MVKDLILHRLGGRVAKLLLYKYIFWTLFNPQSLQTEGYIFFKKILYHIWKWYRILFLLFPFVIVLKLRFERISVHLPECQVHFWAADLRPGSVLVVRGGRAAVAWGLASVAGQHKVCGHLELIFAQIFTTNSFEITSPRRMINWDKNQRSETRNLFLFSLYIREIFLRFLSTCF